MNDGYEAGGYSQDHADAVAALMYRLGRAFNMVYGYKGSSSNALNAIAGLTNYYGMDKSTRVRYRDMYTDTEWEQLVYDELSRGVPVMYNGTTKDEVGHCFVVDGYTESETGFSTDAPGFHVNWGWRGSYNGFFPLTGTNALTPDGTGAGGDVAGSSYTNGQHIVSGLKLNEGKPMAIVGRCTGYLLSDGTTAATTATAKAGATTYIYANSDGMGLYNYSAETTSITFGVSLTDTEGTTTYQTLKTLSDAAPFSGIKSSGISYTAPTTTGTYTVGIVYKDEYGEWQSATNTTYTLTVEESENALILTGTKVGNNGYIIGCDVNENGEKQEYGDGKLIFTVKNNTNADIIAKNILVWVFEDGVSESIGYFALNYNSFNVGIEKKLEVKFNQFVRTPADYYVPGKTYKVQLYNYTDGYAISGYIPLTAVEEKEVDYTLTDAGWGTLTLPFDASVPDGLTVYEVTGVDNDGVLTKTKVNSLEMDKPYLVTGIPNTYSFSGPDTPASLIKNGLLYGTTGEDTYAPQGSYVLQKQHGVVAFYEVQNANTQKMSQYSAYLVKPASAEAYTALLLGDDTATAIKNVNNTSAADSKARKAIIDGKLVIEKDGKTYTITGAYLK